MKKKIIKISIGILVVFLFLGGVFLLTALNYNYSTGNRTGRLMKFSERGYIFKTYEGTLDLNNISRNNTGTISSTWEFSVADNNPQVFAEIDKAMTENKVVKLHYEEKLFKFSWRGDTKYFVNKVEVVHLVNE
jgi:hypothetical protein